MNKNKNLEDVLKEKFSDMELHPSPGSWERLSKELNGKQTYNYIWWIAASIACVGVMLSIYLLKFDSTSGSIAVHKQRKNEKSVKQFDKIQQAPPVSIIENTDKVDPVVIQKKSLPTVRQIEAPTPSASVLAFQTEGCSGEFTLPDSSKVYLNKYSKIELKEFDLHKRTVVLSGEAFFEVKKHDGLPFHVISGNSITQVVGTAFAIRPYKTDSMEVLVTEGKVRFGHLDNPDAFVLLSPGERAVLHDKNVKKYLNWDQNSLTWKTGMLSFSNTKMSDAIKTLENHFNVKINVSDPSILKCHVTAKVKNTDIRKTLDLFSGLLKIKYTNQGDMYLLTGKGCK